MRDAMTGGMAPNEELLRRDSSSRTGGSRRPRWYHALSACRYGIEQRTRCWASSRRSELPPNFVFIRARYHNALALATELGTRPLVAHCHLGLGTLYRRTRKREQAQGHLTTAVTMYREMEMRFWLEQAEAEMRESA
jgi:hypothetical protein